MFQSIPSIDGTCIDLERAKEQQEALVKVEENIKQLGHGFFLPCTISINNVTGFDKIEPFLVPERPGH